MEKELISKKDLLDLMNISYGQLYRWKRKNLIPEHWFIRKSTFTGQETFFPKSEIIQRIEKIQNMKDDLSLDEISDLFSPNFSNVNITISELENRNIVSKNTLQVFLNLFPNKETFTLKNIAHMFIVNTQLENGNITLEDCNSILKTLEETLSIRVESNFNIIITRKLGITTCFIISTHSNFFIEEKAKVIANIDYTNEIDTLRSKLGGL
ncbi:MAG: hypothetical protein K0S34_1077 [Bacillales bacterium]|jgi:DNA-binding transcriptional MerR regulator|nr:hypothetical protein [Bacillales bacterium]